MESMPPLTNQEKLPYFAGAVLAGMSIITIALTAMKKMNSLQDPFSLAKISHNHIALIAGGSGLASLVFAKFFPTKSDAKFDAKFDKQDSPDATKLAYCKSWAEKGNASAMTSYGNALLKGTWGATIDQEKGVRWLEAAIEKKSSSAYLNLIKFLAQSNKLKMQEKAVKWLEHLANAKSSPRFYSYAAFCYQTGKFVEQDTDKAERLYKLALEKSDPTAHTKGMELLKHEKYVTALETVVGALKDTTLTQTSKPGGTYVLSKLLKELPELYKDNSQEVGEMVKGAEFTLNLANIELGKKVHDFFGIASLKI